MHQDPQFPPETIREHWRRKATGTRLEPTTGIELLPFWSIKLGTERREIVKGLIPREGLILVWGPPKCGKSFWVYDLTMHIALGREYRGLRTEQGAVVYCAFEGQHGFRARIAAFTQECIQAEQQEVPFFLMPSLIDLAQDHATLARAVREHCIPSVVVLDTLNRSLRGSESRDEDMGAYLRAADTIRETFNCAVIIVHHCGIDGTRPRGHSSLGGAIETQIAVSRDANENIVATVELNKEGPDGARVVSKLQSIEVGQDEDGDPITSCIVIPGDDTEPAAKPSRKLTNRQKLARDALLRAVTDRGTCVPPSFGLPGSVLAVPLDTWREEMMRIGAIDKDAANERADFRRLKDALQAYKHVAVQDGLAWPC